MNIEKLRLKLKNKMTLKDEEIKEMLDEIVKLRSVLTEIAGFGCQKGQCLNTSVTSAHLRSLAAQEVKNWSDK